MNKKNQTSTDEKKEKIFDRPVLLLLSGLILVAAFLIAEAFNNHSRTVEQYKFFHNKTRTIQ
jgi:hypothetical protein